MGPKITSPSFFVGRGGGKLISFGSGQPDLAPPKEVYKVDLKKVPFKYGFIQGNLNLRSALTKEYPDSNPNQFVITNGASEALDLTLRHIAERGGKRILIPRPYYYSYPGLVQLAGMEPVFTDLVRGKIDLDDFEEKIHDCDAVLINSPGNPTGTIQDIKTLKFIEKMCKDLNKIIISDEVYRDLHYERQNHLMDGEHVVTINSFSKTYSMCGYRVGYLHSHDPALVQGAINIKNWSSMNTSNVGQEMALNALTTYKKTAAQIKKVFKERRDFIYKGMVELGLDLWKPEGAFYVFPKFKDSNKVVNELYYKHKVITYDGAWFGDPSRVRFSYALDIKQIEEGLKRVKKYLESRK
jgi:aspartate aminotransferase